MPFSQKEGSSIIGVVCERVLGKCKQFRWVRFCKVEEEDEKHTGQAQKAQEECTAHHRLVNTLAAILSASASISTQDSQAQISTLALNGPDLEPFTTPTLSHHHQ